MIRLFLSAVVVMAALTPTTFAQSKEQDERVRKSVVAVVNAGSDVYNAGDQLGCSRMYQGALLALIPQLDHRLDLQRDSQLASEMANRVPNVSQRAFAQRAVLDKILAGLSSPLYERLGGEAAIRAVVDDFVARAASNPKVNFTRKGTAVEWAATPDNVARLKTGLMTLIGQVTGGPQKYAGKDMKKAHAGMMITDAEFDALAGDLKATLDHFKVPTGEQNELLKIVGTTRGEIVEKK